jgi:hypothetical protein
LFASTVMLIFFWYSLFMGALSALLKVKSPEASGLCQGIGIDTEVRCRQTGIRCRCSSLVSDEPYRQTSMRQLTLDIVTCQDVGQLSIFSCIPRYPDPRANPSRLLQYIPSRPSVTREISITTMAKLLRTMILADGACFGALGPSPSSVSLSALLWE